MLSFFSQPYVLYSSVRPYYFGRGLWRGCAERGSFCLSIFVYPFQSLARLGASVTGIDASAAAVKVATDHAQKDQILVKNLPTYINTSAGM